MNLLKSLKLAYRIDYEKKHKSFVFLFFIYIVWYMSFMLFKET